MKSWEKLSRKEEKQLKEERLEGQEIGVNENENKRRRKKMKKAKKLTAALLALTLVAGMAGCTTEAPGGGSSDSADSGSSSDEGVRIAASFMSLNNPFWIAENDVLKEEIEKRGGELVTYDAQLNLETQISQIEDAVASGVDAVIVSPYDWKGIRPALESCNAKNIPVVVIDTKVFDSDLVETQVVSDNELGGKLCAEAIAEHLGGEGNVAIVDFSTNMAVQDRTKGFEEALAEYPDIKIVARQDAEGSVESALPVMENMLQANENIDAVFGTNDPAAIGAIAAIESAGKLDDIAVVGIDGAQDACELIKEGKLLGTAAQYPSLLATEVVNQIYKILDGEEPDDDIIYIEEQWVDAENVEEYQETNAY